MKLQSIHIHFSDICQTKISLNGGLPNGILTQLIVMLKKNCVFRIRSTLVALFTFGARIRLGLGNLEDLFVRYGLGLRVVVMKMIEVLQLGLFGHFKRPALTFASGTDFGFVNVY